MTERSLNPLEKSLLNEPGEGQRSPVNFKRILARAVRYWYLIVLSVMTALTVAYLVNRYTTRIYPVTASIIVREGDENAGAKFLYNNALVNPARNFYNELYVMRSYPLLQEVVEQLDFDVTWYREGDLKTSEVYDRAFPIGVDVCGGEKPYGRQLNFRVVNEASFDLGILKADGTPERVFEGLRFNDTVAVNGFRLLFKARGNLAPEIGKPYLIRFTDPYKLAKSYSSRLRTTWAEPGASVVNLDISGPLPEKEIDFLNKFIERYQQFDVDKKNLVATKSIVFLNEQLVSIGDSLKRFDDRIETFKQQHRFTNFDAQTQRIFQRMEEYDSRKSQMDLQHNYYVYLENYLKESDAFDQVVPPSVVGISDNILTGLVQELTSLQFSIRALGDQQNVENPLVKDQIQRIQQIKRDLMEGLNSVRSAHQINREFVNREIAKLERELESIPAFERSYLDIRRDYTVRENLYLFLMQKRAEAGISKASTTSDIVVVNPPSQKGGPLTPKPVENYTIAFAVGLIFPFLFFVLAEILNDRVQSKEDIEQLTSIPVIGGVGHNALTPNNLVVLNKPKSAMAESFRALRSNLNYFTEGQDKKLILVTSSLSGEGKTFTTINLATVMAFAGKKVLIIGADMRRPKIYTDFNLTNDTGLSTYLSSMAALDEVIQKTPIENLDLMSSGPVPPNPGELLLSPKTGEMIKTLLEQYDYIILDTPPVGLVADAFTLMPMAHHTIFLVRQNQTPRSFLTHMQELFESRKIRNVSILFNDIRVSGPGYGYGYHYGYGYGYGYGNGYAYGYGSRKDKSGYYLD